MVRLVLPILVVLVVAGCGGETATTEGAQAPATETGDSSAAASFEGETLEGGRLSLADLRGTPVFVNVWASW